MLILTIPDGHTVTGFTDVDLASNWLNFQHGDGWEDGLIPFDEHTAMNDAIEELALIGDGIFSGYTLTTPTVFEY